MTWNGLNTAAVWACLVLILANWRLTRVENMLPDAPSGLRWVRVLSFLTLITLLGWGMTYSGLDPAYSRLVSQISCLTIGAALPAAFEVFFGLLRRRMNASLRVTLWTACLSVGMVTAAAGFGPPIQRKLPLFGAEYSVPSIAPWVIASSIFGILVLLGFIVAVLRLFQGEERRIVRSMALGALLLAGALVHDQVNSNGIIPTPRLVVWGYWLWVLAFAIAAEQLAQQRIRDLRSRSQIAEARTGARSAFLANMSHELRTPLGGLLGLTDLLLDDQGLSPRQIRLAHALHGSANRLRQLIDEVLELEKLELGKAALIQTPFLVESWADKLEKRAKGLVPNGDITVRLEALPIGLLGGALIGDEERLAKALLNLVANALRHTRRGEVSVALRSHKIEEGQADLRFVVRDTGSRIGRPDRSLSKTLRDDRLSDQLADDPNLSLALALRLTELVGGRLHLQTASGLGSTYTLSIRMPFVAPEDLPHELRLKPAPAVDADAPRELDGHQILVVDDHPVNRLILARPLEQAGAIVRTCGGAVEALEFMETQAVNLVLMDLHMPEMDGIAGTGEIRRREAEGRFAHAGRVPVIAISADVTERAKQACREAGMIGFIPKPYDRHLLLENVAAALNLQATNVPEQTKPEAGGALADVLAMVDGDRNLAAEVVREYLMRSPGLLSEIDGALEHWDHESLVRHAHTLKGSLLTLGFTQAGEGARALEHAARKGQRTECGEVIAQLHRDLAQVDAAMLEFLDDREEG